MQAQFRLPELAAVPRPSTPPSRAATSVLLPQLQQLLQLGLVPAVATAQPMVAAWPVVVASGRPAQLAWPAPGWA